MESKTWTPVAGHLTGSKWTGMVQPDGINKSEPTGVPESILREVGIASVKKSANFNIHQRLDRMFIQPRIQRVEKGEGIDWATAESLAFGSLLVEGYNVRLSGQDVARGTFSQRHLRFIE